MKRDSEEAGRSDAESTTAAPDESRRPVKERLKAEIKSRPFGYAVLAVFLVTGPILAPILFPQAPPGAAIVGGLAFGVYAALSAVPQKFI
ncbi:MAG: hypothetical protein GY910_18440 [bacterium]|nr:hypothetical protein [Deltaproteobacteria bacterium]MCP4906957.1 hypothetical protein [bacterium]